MLLSGTLAELLDVPRSGRVGVQSAVETAVGVRRPRRAGRLLPRRVRPDAARDHRARPVAVRRAAPAPRARPLARRRPADPRARRADERGRLAHRGPHRRGAARGPRGAYDGGAHQLAAGARPRRLVALVLDGVVVADRPSPRAAARRPALPRRRHARGGDARREAARGRASPPRPRPGTSLPDRGRGDGAPLRALAAAPAPPRLRHRHRDATRSPSIAGLAGPIVLGGLVESLTTGTTAAGDRHRRAVVPRRARGPDGLHPHHAAARRRPRRGGARRPARGLPHPRGQRCPPASIERAGTGDLVSRTTTDIDRLNYAGARGRPADHHRAASPAVLVAGALRRSPRRSSRSRGCSPCRRS